MTWVDFQAVKASADFRAVLASYGVVVGMVNAKGDARVVCRKAVRAIQ